MGIISVTGQSGRPYQVQIAGDAPSPEEQARIDQYVQGQESLTSGFLDSAFGRYQPAPVEEAPAPEIDPNNLPGTALGRGARRGLANLQSTFGTATEELGRGTGIESLQGFGQRMEQSADERLAALGDQEGATVRQDVQDVGSGLSYAGELAGEQAPLLATTLAGAGLGAMAGAGFAGIGAVPGALLGGAAAAFPMMFGSNVQRQEEQVAAGELEDVSIQRALVAAVGQSAVESIAGKMLAFMPFRPGVGNLFARTARGVAAGAATEVPTEVTQQIIERAQAGLPIDSDDAIQEYLDAAVAAGILGGGLGGAGSAVAGDRAQIELDNDFNDFIADSAQRLNYVDMHTRDDERATDEILALPAPDAGPQAVGLLAAPEPEAIFEGRDFGRNEYNAVLQQVQQDGELSFPKAQAALRQQTGAPVPMQRVRDIASVLEQQGEIGYFERGKKVDPSVRKGKYTIAPKSDAVAEGIKGIQRDTESVARRMRKLASELPQLELDLRYAEQTGRDTRGKPTTVGAVQKAIQSKQVQLNKLDERLSGNADKLKRANTDFSVPVTESIGLPVGKARMSDFIEQNRMEQEAQLLETRKAADARAAFEATKATEEKSAPPVSERYTQKQTAILNNLNDRLKKLGLKDVKLDARRILGTVDNGIAEGAAYTTPEGQQVIALSLGLYDPNLSAKDYEARLSQVMDHEIVHAVRSLGLFTKKELQLLSRAARKTRYVKKGADGKAQKRAYTYFDRAARLNPELSVKKDGDGVLSALEEEAIAEMFRDVTSGTLKNIGQSRSILKRIVDFMRSIVGAHTDNGFNSVDEIYQGINQGAVGARTRQPITQQELEIQDGQTQPKYSRSLGFQQGNLGPERAGDGRRRDQGRSLAPLEGAPTVKGASGPDPNLIAVADKYAAQKGIDLRRQSEFVMVNDELASRIAEAYDAMPHNPQDPAVREAYQDLIRQTKDQYDALAADGFEFTFFDGATDPYDGNPWNAMRDLRANKKMAVYGTYDGFGTEGITQKAVDDNYMLQDTGVRWPDQQGIMRPVTANDMFRAVHDAFGHGIEGAGFRARGEENAWQAHVRMFTGPALGALTSETRGQNSWMNYGPYGERNRTASVEDSVFAEQKTGLMPEWTWLEGRAGNEGDPKFSRLAVNIPNDLRGASILDYLDPETGKPLFRNKPNSNKLVPFAKRVRDLRTYREMDISDPRDQQAAALVFAAEAEMALKSSPDAIGWYGKTLDLAKQVMSQIYPEISKTLPGGGINPGYDPNAEVALDFATAITSNGLAVTDNFDFAARQYEAWKSSEDGTFPILGDGKQGSSMHAAFEFWNYLTETGMTPTEINDLLVSVMPRKELNQFVADKLGLDSVKDLPTKYQASTSELANEMVSVAYLLGPKIGNGFYRNLRGDFDPLTMDRWWMRFVNRVTGKPLKEIKDLTIQKNIDDIWKYLSEKTSLTDLDNQILSSVKKRLDSGRVTKSSIPTIGPAINAEYERVFKRAYDQKLKELEAQGRSSSDVNVRRIAQAARPERSPFLKIIGTYTKNIEDTLQEDPRSATDRKNMRDVTDIARRILKEQTGTDITNADFQALMWYAEKRIMAAGGVRKGKGDDNDYVDGAIYALRKRGVSDDQIKNSLPDDERYRVDARTDEFQTDQIAGEDFVELPNEKELGGAFFRPRRFAVSDRDTAERLSEDIPPRGYERANFNQKNSRIPVYSRTTPAPTKGIGPMDLASRAEMTRYNKVQDVLGRTFKKMPFMKNVDIEDKTNRFFTKLQDSMLPLGVMYDKLRQKYGPGIISQDMDAYFQETLVHGVVGPKKEKFDRTFFQPTLELIANTKITDAANAAMSAGSKYYREILEKSKNRSHAIANAYLYAKHALERNAEISRRSKGEIDSGSGMSNKEALEIIKIVNGMPAMQRNSLNEVVRRVQEMVRNTNETYIDGGLIPDYIDGDLEVGVKEAFGNYDFYVPLRGFSDPEMDLDPTSEMRLSSTQKYGAKGKPDPTALGRSSYAGDILANVAVQNHQAIDRAERNKVGQSLLKLLEQKDIDTDEFGTVLATHPLKRTMVNGTIRHVPDRDFDQLDEPILSVRRDGKEYLIAMQPDIAKAMKGALSPKQSNAVVRASHAITRAYASLLTTYNPVFTMSNLPRDIATALFNAQQYGMKGAEYSILRNTGPAMKSILKVLNGKTTADPRWAERYKQFYENGGQNNLNQMADMINTSKDIQKTIREIVEADAKGARAVVKRKMIGGGRSLLGYIEAVNSAVENGTRLAFFDAMVTQLESEGVPSKDAYKRAAFAARNLTTNFSKGGEWKNGLNSFYLFFNASLQGSMAIFNSLANSPKARKVAAGIVVFGFLMDQLNALVSDEDDETGIKDWDNISDFTLSHNLIMPDLNGDGTFVRIPMAYGLNTMFDFGRVTSNLARGAAGNEGTYTPEQAAKQLISVVEEMVNPLGGDSALTFLSPTIGDLPVELMTNRNFMGSSIYKEASPYEQFRSRSGLYWSTTSPSAIWVSSFLNDTLGGGDDFIPGEIAGMRVDIQPDVIEHILGFMTGGVGALANQFVDTATSNIPNAAVNGWEADMIRTTPFLSKFLTSVTEKSRTGDYYEKRDDVFAVRRSFRAAAESGDREQIANLRRRYPEIVRLMEPIQQIDSAISRINRAKRVALRNPSLTRQRRLEIEDEFDRRINDLRARALMMMQDI